jgi:hypothetical protein
MSKGFFGSLTEFFTNETPQSFEKGEVKGVSAVADAPTSTTNPLPTPPVPPIPPASNQGNTPEWSDFLEKKEVSMQDIVTEPSPRAVFTDVSRSNDEPLNLTEPVKEIEPVEEDQQKRDLRPSSFSSADAVLDLEGPAVSEPTEDETKKPLPDLPPMDASKLAETTTPTFKGMAPEKLEKLRTFFQLQREEDEKSLEAMKASLKTLDEAQQKHNQEKEQRLSEITTKEQALKDERAQLETEFQNAEKDRLNQISETTAQITDKEVQLKLEQEHFDKAIKDLSSDETN